MADVQAGIQAAADEMVASGTETGLQIAVRQHGHVVADVVSGVADPRTGAGVRPGTLFYAASAAKGVAASLAHVLAERGDLGYDLRVADVWPEFGTRGKDRVTLRHVLLHTAGLPGLPSRPQSSSSATGTTCARCWPPPNRGGNRAPGSATTR